MSHLLLRAHVLDGLRALPDESVHCVVTSPPYYSLRDYRLPTATFGDSWCGQLGLEPTPDAFVSHLVEIFREARRVLRGDGTAFVVLGDSYANDAKWGGASGGKHVEELHGQTGIGRGRRDTGLNPGDLMGIPWRFAFAAQADGWILRSAIVWSKRSCMPESVSGTRWEQHREKLLPSGQSFALYGSAGNRRIPDASGGVVNAPRAEWRDCPGCAKCRPRDGLILRRGSWRPTTAHEFIFMLAKSGEYFADGEELREAWADARRGASGNLESDYDRGRPDGWTQRPTDSPAVSGRNVRSVWELGPEPLAEAHYAAFPSEVARRCVLAGTSSGGCCAECGAPQARVLRREKAPAEVFAGRAAPDDGFVYSGSIVNGEWRGQGQKLQEWRDAHPPRTLGWRPTCSCASAAVPSVVLDPFVGSGTTGRVALSLGRRFIGIDLSAAYLFGFCRQRVVEADVAASLAEPLRLKSIDGPLFNGTG